MLGKGSYQDWNWPLPKFHFVVTFPGLGVWWFQEVSGLETEVDIIEYRHGRSKQLAPMKRPGMPKVSDVTLKKGVFTGDTLSYMLFAKANTKDFEKNDVTISLLNEYHMPEVIWTLTKAFPKKIESTNLNSQTSEIAIESMVLSYEELVIDNVVSMGIKLAKKLL
ncbi:MAG TPA: phage tail protein [Flavobacteriales bacterium]|jgi:phage tail-like protein|nr:phage tail protein [Salibacteraceae bacterium]HAS36266.1 phage tail protein [Flavobacteriales bacterium]